MSGQRIDEVPATGPILVHIGYPKTGTTYLQHVLFRPDSPAFFPLDRRRANDLLVTVPPFDFDAEATRRFFDSEIRSRPIGDSRLPVLSQEGLVNILWAYGARSREIADRIRATFGDRALIMIVVREQVAQILSHFSEYKRKGGRLGLRKFLAQDRIPESHTSVFRLSIYNYDGLVRYYQGLFGADRVLTLPFEMMREDPSDFYKRLFAFCGVEPDDAELHTPGGPIRPSQPITRLKLARFTRRYHVATSLRPDGRDRPMLMKGCLGVESVVQAITPARLDRMLRDRWRSEIDAFVGDSFAASNDRLSELTGFDLRAYGYRLPEATATG